jgi:hypothetical protein
MSMTKLEIESLEYRLKLITLNLPAGYTAHIGIVISTLKEDAKLTSYKAIQLADIVINDKGECVKNRWGFTK